MKIWLSNSMRLLALSVLGLLPEVLVANLVQVDQVSNPVGFLSQITATKVGETITTNQPPLSQDGYVFGYWSSGSGRLSDVNGQSPITPTVEVKDTLVLTAHYFPENEDLDSDGLPDWYEYRNFGNLSKNASDDPDQDGYSILVEKQLGQETIIPDLVEDGGISFASSNLVTYADFNVLTYSSRSDPQGLIDPVSRAYTAETVVSSPTLNGETEGYYFAYWSLNGVRQENPSGVALNQVKFKLTTNSELIAHFLPTGQDDDGDRLVDWYEIYQFGDLNQDGGSDPDSDGFTNDEEIKLGQAPMILDLVEDGGLSFASSTTVSFVSDNLLAYSIDSEPTGFSEKLSGASAVGNLISTPTLQGEKNGYHFAYWSLNGVRQTSSSGVALNQVDLQISVRSELVAHYIPSGQDTDGDGLMDWFELNQFGNLNQNSQSDPDGDSYDNLTESLLGQEATIADKVEDGGISFSSSPDVFYFIQSYDRLDGLELNNTQFYSLKASGLDVGHFTEVDHKKSANSRYTFSLVPGEGSADNSKFNITNNQLTTNEVLLQGTYSIRVRVANHLNISYEKSFLLSSIQDPNTINTAPNIISNGGGEKTYISIVEGQKFVTTIQADDADGDPLIFSLAEENDFEHFSVGLNDGNLEFTFSPDFEFPKDSNRDNLYKLTVICSDGKLQDSQTIQIQVDDLAENVGVVNFELSPSSISENKPVNSEIGKFSVDLDDQFQNPNQVKYALVSGTGDTGNQFVEIVENTKLISKHSFDFEQDSTFSIRAKVSASSGASQIRNFSIEISDVFENQPPAFTSFDGSLSAQTERIENQVSVTTLTAADPDRQPLTFSLVEEKDYLHFSLSSTSGVLAFQTPPDFENPSDINADNIYEVTLKVSDGISTDQQSLRILITDNPNEAFSGRFLLDQAFIDENKPTGSPIGKFLVMLNNGDKDTAANEYSLVIGEGDEGNSYVELEETGEIVTKQSFDYEEMSSFSIRAKVTNPTGSSQVQKFIIEIKDVLENRAPTFTSFNGVASAQVEVVENYPKGLIFSASDSDSQTLTFSLKPEKDYQLFNLSPLAGLLTFQTPPDYEDPSDTNSDNRYDVTVSVSDGTASKQQSVSISVLNDPTEILSGKLELTPGLVSENKPVGSEIGIFSFTPESSMPNTSTFSYQLISGTGDSGNQYVKIKNGNQLVSTRIYDYEQMPFFSVRIRISAPSGATQVKTLKIAIEDIFENQPPAFTSFNKAESAEIEIKENRNYVASFSATDPDKQTLTYVLKKEKDYQIFSLSTATGLLTFDNPPDFETPKDFNGNNQYDISVLVSDGLAIDQQNLKVTILDDVNEDSDEDGLNDKRENQIGTDPNKKDTDGDGHSDGEEVKQKTKPLDPNDYPGVIRGFDFSKLKMITENDNHQGQTSQVEFQAVRGTSYYFAVDGTKSNRGVAKLSLQYNELNSLNSLSALSSGNETLDEFELIEMEVFDSFTNPGFAWESNADGIVAVTANQSIPETTVKVFKQVNDGQLLLVNASSSENFSDLHFSASLGDSFIFEVIGLDESNAIQYNLTIETLANQEAPTNDTFNKRSLISGRSASLTGTITGSSSELGEPMHALLPPPQKSIWWKWQAPVDGTLLVEALGENFTAVPKVYAGFEVNDLIEIDSTSQVTGTLKIEVKQGVEYAIVVAAYGNSKGEVALSLDLSSSDIQTGPSNDAFENAFILTGSSTTTSGTNYLATGQFGEPLHAESASPLNSAWWQWTPASSALTTISTDGSGFDTTLAIYTGDQVTDLERIASNDDHENARTSQVEFLPTAGRKYLIAVDGFEHSTGEIKLSLNQELGGLTAPANDEIKNAVPIPALNYSVSGSNLYATGSENEMIYPSSAHPLASSWWTWTASKNQQVIFDTIGSSFDTTLAVYRSNSPDELSLIESNDDYFGSSSLVSFLAESGTIYYLCVDGKGFSAGSISLKGRNADNFGSGDLTPSKLSSIFANPANLSSNQLRINQSSDIEEKQYNINGGIEGQDYRISMWETQEYDWTEGGETSDGISLSSMAKISAQSLIRRSGQKAYKFIPSLDQESWMVMDRWIYCTPYSSVSWWEYCNATQDHFRRVLEYSVDGEVTWHSLDDDHINNQSSFVHHKTSLHNLQGQVVKLRFRIPEQKSALAANGDQAGWFLDDLSFDNTYCLGNPSQHTTQELVVSVQSTSTPMSLLTVESIDQQHTFGFSSPTLVFKSNLEAILSFFDGLSNSDNGWRQSTWYGPFYLLENSSWFFTPTRGWLYFGEVTIGGAWIFDADVGWFWTSNKIYPWIYSYEKSHWVLDYSLHTGSRTFLEQ